MFNVLSRSLLSATFCPIITHIAMLSRFKGDWLDDDQMYTL